MSKALTRDHLHLVAERFDVEVPLLQAIVAVESGGAGFLPDGRPKILLEGHHVWKRLQGRGIDPRALAKAHPSVCHPRWTRANYRGGAAEYGRLDLVIQFGQGKPNWESYKKVAYESASWGLFQLMGFNYGGAGFADVYQFKAAHERSELEHLTAACEWMKQNGLLEKLRRKQWVPFVTGYNGPGQVPVYAPRLIAAYNRAVKAAAAAAPKPAAPKPAATPAREHVKLTNALIRKAIARYGSTAPGELAIVGVRGAVPAGDGETLIRQPNTLNLYNDALVLFGPTLRAFRGSVDPGRTYTLKPLNPAGCAHLVNGRWQYRKGPHKGNAALVQAAPVTVRRDRDRDGAAESGESLDTGYFGLNIHAGGTAPDIGSHSAGCQVIAGGWDGKPWLLFYGEIRRSGQERFQYFLIDFSDLVKASE